ncbi:MAG: D-amino-acid dehydrogenase [Motiliproteus sp.]|jgi:D-amino-acid dehydrogenase
MNTLNPILDRPRLRMSPLQRLRKVLDALYLGCGGISALFLLAILCIIVAQMTCRWLGLQFPGSTAYAGYCMAASSFFALAYTLNTNTHIRVTLFIQGLGRRSRRVADIALHLEQAREAGAEQWLTSSPYYYLYRNRQNFNQDSAAWEARSKRGVRYDLLESQQVRELEPAVSDAFGFMAALHNHGFSRNPEQLVKALARSFQDRGGEILLREVRDIEFHDGRPSALVTHKEPLPIDKLVIAAGAWSRKLVAKLDRDVPLQSERGYHIEVSAPGIKLNSPIMFAEGKLVATPMTGGIRFAGLVELGDLDAEPNARFASRLLQHAKKLFPEIDTRDYQQWMGHRPSLPDSLPVIGRSSNHDSVYYAFGHQHMGLTLGPRTGQLIAELVSTGQTGIDLDAYSINRF